MARQCATLNSRFPVLLVAAALLLSSQLILNRNAAAQDVFDPHDKATVYNPSAPPEAPSFGEVSKWVRTKIFDWNSESYKPYFFKGIAFRLKYPKSYGRTHAQAQYPLIVFLAGSGERGSIYDNESQLRHGGKRFAQMVDTNAFDGFVLFPQLSSSNQYYSKLHGDILIDLISKEIVPKLGVDRNRIILHGTSTGAALAWDLIERFPQWFAGLISISYLHERAASPAYFNIARYKALWLFQGRLAADQESEALQTISQMYRHFRSNGKHTEFPYLGHRCWNAAWNTEGFSEFLTSAHLANPIVSRGLSQQCGDTPKELTLAVAPGFELYEWRRNGAVIPGENSNTLDVREFGDYDCRVFHQDQWSTWSRKPIVVKNECSPLQIELAFPDSVNAVLPSIDGYTKIHLQAPVGFAAYQWMKDGISIPTQMTSTLTIGEPGTYSLSARRFTESTDERSNEIVIAGNSNAQQPFQIPDLRINPVDSHGMAISWRPSKDNGKKVEIYRAYFDAREFQRRGVVDMKKSSVTLPARSSDLDLFQIRCPVRDGALLAITPSSKVLEGNRIEISWPNTIRARINADTCDLLRSRSARAKYFLIGTVPIERAAFTDSTVLPSRTVSYVFRLFDHHGASSFSGDFIVQSDADQTPPPRPRSLRATEVHNDTVDLIWQPLNESEQVRSYLLHSETIDHANKGDAWDFFPLDPKAPIEKITLRAQDSAGNISAPTAPLSVNSEQRKFEYFFFPAATKLAGKKFDAGASFDVASGPARRITLSTQLEERGFSALWRGYIPVLEPGEYQIKVESTGSARVYISDAAESLPPLVFPANDEKQDSFTVNLSGPRARFALLHSDVQSDARVSVYWKNREQREFKPIPLLNSVPR